MRKITSTTTNKLLTHLQSFVDMPDNVSIQVSEDVAFYTLIVSVTYETNSFTITYDYQLNSIQSSMHFKDPFSAKVPYFNLLYRVMLNEVKIFFDDGPWQGWGDE